MFASFSSLLYLVRVRRVGEETSFGGPCLKDDGSILDLSTVSWVVGKALFALFVEYLVD